jgi:hypothetical protein
LLFLRRSRCYGRATALALTALAVPAISNAATPRFDGLWSVSIVTEKGNCDRGYRYPIRITHGVLNNGGSDPFTISGQVSSSGTLAVTISNGSKSATGSGKLEGSEGEGFWQGGSCSGTWTAERRGT